MSKIWLIAIDESENSSYSFQYAIRYASPNDIVYLIHISDDRVSIFSTEYSSDEDNKSKSILSYYGLKAKELKVLPNLILLRGFGKSGETISETVKYLGINQLLIGRRERSSVMQNFLLGSTSRYCVENAECNVIVVKNPPKGGREVWSEDILKVDTSHLREGKLPEDRSYQKEVPKLMIYDYNLVEPLKTT